MISDFVVGVSLLRDVKVVVFLKIFEYLLKVVAANGLKSSVANFNEVF